MPIFYPFTDSGVAAIPSQSAVLAAKEKRERMRTTGPASSRADEYISLSLATRDDGYHGPHPESRLMREDDDLGEGDDGMFVNRPSSPLIRFLFARFFRIYECQNSNSPR